MNLLAWLTNPGYRGQAIYKLYDDDAENTSQALADLRQRGALTDGSLRGADLGEAQLADADLSGADLEEVSFKEADLTSANLEGTNLTWADFSGASLKDTNLRNAILYEASFYETDLTNADFTGADVREAVFDGADLTNATITPDQLAQASMLYNTTMPDGTPYDGRYQLAGDVKPAREGRRDLSSSFDMAAWYEVSEAEYLAGQAWAAEHLPALHERIKAAHAEAALRYEAVEAGEDSNEEETVESELSYEEGDLQEGIALIVDIFAEPERLQAYRRLSWNRDGLLAMGAWLAALLVWLPTIVMTAVDIIGRLVSMFSRRPMPYLTWRAELIETGIIVLALVTSLIAYWLTGWSASKRKGGIETHLAQAVVYLIAWRILSHRIEAAAVFIGLILAHILLSAIGTRRSRRLIFTVAMLHLLYRTPLYDLWGSTILNPLMQPGQFDPIHALGFSFYMQASLMGHLLGTIDALLWSWLILWALNALRTRITGKSGSGPVAQMLLALYSALTVIAAPVSLIWPFIRNTISF